MVISTAKFPPLRIAACGSVGLAGAKPGGYIAEQPSCRRLAGRDLISTEAGMELVAGPAKTGPAKN